MPRKPSKKAGSQSKRVLFSISAPEAKAVSLAGGFNEWDTQSLPMKRDPKGVWKVTLDLNPGRYEYRFLVDGVWRDDPSAKEKVDNPFGTHNSVRTVR